jgi:hypothetical protein
MPSTTIHPVRHVPPRVLSGAARVASRRAGSAPVTELLHPTVASAVRERTNPATTLTFFVTTIERSERIGARYVGAYPHPVGYAT